MSTLENILSLLDRWPSWRRITAAPERLEALEARVAELESRLARAPGLACPSCGALEFRVAESRPLPGRWVGLIRDFRCRECGYEETREEVL